MLVMFHNVNQKESNPYSYTFLSSTNLCYLMTKTTKPNAISNNNTEIIRNLIGTMLDFHKVMHI